MIVKHVINTQAFHRSFLTRLSFFIMALLAISCGGESGDNNDQSGIDGSGGKVISTGPVAVDNSSGLSVNGRQFDSSSTTFFKSGVPSSADEIEDGSTVTLIGETAPDSDVLENVTVNYFPKITGTVSEIKNESEFTVLGQTIIATDLTRYSGIKSFGDIEIGQTVEVSGTESPNGVVAYKVTLVTDPEQSSREEISGDVIALNLNDEVFVIDNLRVRYENAKIEGDIAELVEGAKVFAEGAFEPFVLSNTIAQASPLSTFNATRLFIVQGYPQGDVDADIRGVITKVTTAQSFQLGFTEVTYAENVEVINGTLADIGFNVDVLVTGQAEVAGSRIMTLVAEKIEILQTLPLGAIGEVTALLPDINAVELQVFNLNVAGFIQIFYDETTSFNDSSSFEGGENTRNDVSFLEINDLVDAFGFTKTNRDNLNFPDIEAMIITRIPNTTPLSNGATPYSTEYEYKGRVGDIVLGTEGQKDIVVIYIESPIRGINELPVNKVSALVDAQTVLRNVSSVEELRVNDLIDARGFTVESKDGLQIIFNSTELTKLEILPK